MNRRILTLASLAVVCTMTLQPLVAQESLVELMRSDIRTEKIAILTEALALTEAEAETFWPIHRQYEADLAGIGDDHIVLMKNYAETYATMSDDQAKQIAKDWFRLQENQLGLLKKYHKKIEKAVSPRVAAKFVQIENQIGLVIDMQLASETPLIQ